MFAIFLLFNSAQKVKLNRCDEWWFDGDSKEIAEALMKDAPRDSNIMVTGDWLLLMSPNFYLKRAGFQNFILVNKQIDTENDFEVDPMEVQYILIFNNNISHLRNNYTVLHKGLLAELVRIEK